MIQRVCFAGLLSLWVTSAIAAEPPKVEEVEIDERSVTIRFDQPMLTWLGESRTSLLRITPATDCRWYWEDGETLQCTMDILSGDDRLTPATRFQIDVPAGLWSQAGQPLAPTRLEVESPRPSLLPQVLDWHGGQPELIVRAEDAPVDATAIARVLDLTLDGESLAYTLQPLTAAQRAKTWLSEGQQAFHVEPKNWPERRGILKLSLRAGLRSPAGPLLGEAEELLVLVVNPPLRLAAIDCGWDRTAPVFPDRPAPVVGCDADANTRLFFTRRLADGEAQRLAAALGMPEAETANEGCIRNCREPHGGNFAVTLPTRLAGTTLKISLPDDLRGKDGSLISPGATPSLVFGDRGAQVRAEPPLRVLRPGSDAALELELRNVTAPLTVGELSVGRRSMVRDHRLPAQAITNEFFPWRAESPRGGVADRGGLVLAGIRGGGGSGYALAVAPFNVVASSDSERVMVWSSDWDSAAGMAGADVVLFEVDATGREEVLARGRTAADGVAFLPVPAHIKQSARKVRLVRVRHGGRQAVVPVATWSELGIESIPGPEGDEDFYRWTAPESKPVFGVTDSLLYRPGDTVRFRVWPRERRGNRLLAGETTGQAALALKAVDSSTALDEWTADRDAWGSAAGERRLADDLADGVYCIAPPDSPSGWFQRHGGCFEVARFDAQAFWTSGGFDRAVVRPGDPLVLDIEAGFYSGGGAAGALVRVMSRLAPEPFGSVYPAFAQFTFRDGLNAQGQDPELDPLAGFTLPERLDGRGRAQLAGQMPDALRHEDEEGPIAFGRILVNASTMIPGGSWSSSPSASVVYAGHPRYVGLRTEGWWLRTDADPVLEAVVASDDGQPVAAARVQVRIERDGDDGVEVLARCELSVSTPTPCGFRAPTSGRYRFVAESEGAASVKLDRYFYGGGRPDRTEEATAELSVMTPTDGTRDAVLRLRQPHARAMALFVVEYDTVLKHWVQEVGPEAELHVPVSPDWAPGVSVRVLLRPVAEGAAGAALVLETLDAVVRLEIPRAAVPAVEVSLDSERSAPGEERVIRLHNPGTRERLVTLAITDDSVHQQASAMHEVIDPQGSRFLGVLKHWTGADWHGFGAWSHPPNLFEYDVLDEQVPSGFPGGSSTLDSVEVTGSRISRAELMDGAGIDSAAQAQDRTADGPPVARVRSRFPVTAYWNPGEALAPGETREIRVRLPDNLTRWRLLAWSSDSADGFDLAESTLEATLPLELRAGLPSRLFEDDQGSGTVLARVNADAAARVQLQVVTEGAGADGRTSGDGRIQPQASLVQRVPLAPDSEGRIALVARAHTDTNSDALSAAVAVQSRMAQARIAQVGWLEGGPLALARPGLPPGATSPVLEISVSQGTDPWRDDWLRDLRAYPHRCWEQTLSRALGASIALQSADTAAAWPEAGQVIADALRNAPTFRDHEGHFHYFANHGDSYETRFDPVLSAYTLRAFQVMTRLGQPVPERMHADLRTQLHAYVKRIGRSTGGLSSWEIEAGAAAAGSLATEPEPAESDAVPVLWQRWQELSWHGRSELARAAAADPRHADIAAASLAALREGGRRIGSRRVLEEATDLTWLMGSRLRDQCAVTATLWTLDRSPEHRIVREQWLRGLSDLYAGGTGSLDSQASAQCLLALLAVDEVREPGSTDALVEVVAGQHSTSLSLDAETTVDRWETPLAPDAQIGLTPADSGDGTLNYRAEVRYLLDQREAKPEATGMRLQRSYQVLRDGAWRELGDGSVVEGDWLRVTLRLDVPAMRHFVAITDTVPGGLVTRDVRLAGVGGENLQRLADPGSWWFETRQTGATEVRLYAQRLPQGSHDLHYYTQATHAGRYFAPPAVAELMYGRASRSNTGPRTLVVRPAP